MSGIIRNFFFAFLFLFVASAGFCEDYTAKNIYGGHITRVVEAPGAAGTMYAGGQGVFKSLDGGHTWVRKPFPFDAVEIQKIKGPGDTRHNVMDIAVSYADSNIVIAGDEQFSPMWRSTNGGDIWERIGLGADEYSKWLKCKVVTASEYGDKKTFLASMESSSSVTAGIKTFYISRDAGLTWTATSFTAPSTEEIVSIIQIAGGANAGRIVIGPAPFNKDNFGSGSSTKPVSGKIYYCEASAATFIQASFADAPSSMTWDPVNNKVWLLAQNGKVYSSTDGAAWTDSTYTMSKVSPNYYAYRILYNAAAGALYAWGFDGQITNCNAADVLDSVGEAFTGLRIYKNPTAGFPAASWRRLSPQGGNSPANGKIFINAIPLDLAVDSRDTTGNSWGMSTNEDAYTYTTDNGVNLAESTGINCSSTEYGIKDAATNRIYARGSNKIMYSGDNGDTWIKVFPAKGDNDAEISRFVAFHPTDTNKVYLTASQNIRVTTNNGTDNFSTVLADFSPTGSNVTPVPPGTNAYYLSNLVIDPDNANNMLVGILRTGISPLDKYLYKSTDGGTNWNVVNGLTTRGIYYIYVDPSNKNTLYATTGDCGYASTPGVTSDGLYKSIDWGTTWTYVGLSGNIVGTLAIDTDNSNRIWAGLTPNNGDNASVQRTIDGGATWTTLKGDIPYVRDDGTKYYDNAVLTSALVFYVKPTLYVSVYGGKLFSSNDGGDTNRHLATFPGDLQWIFKGSVYAAASTGLYSLSIGVPKAYTGSTVKVYNSPNPFNPNNGLASIRVAIPSNVTSVILKIYTLSGDLVQEVTNGTLLGAYAYGFAWDGKNNKGSLCAPGIYIVTANVGGVVVKNKIVLAY